MHNINFTRAAGPIEPHCLCYTISRPPYMYFPAVFPIEVSQDPQNTCLCNTTAVHITNDTDCNTVVTSSSVMLLSVLCLILLLLQSWTSHSGNHKHTGVMRTIRPCFVKCIVILTINWYCVSLEHWLMWRVTSHTSAYRLSGSEIWHIFFWNVFSVDLTLF